jgi:hypothetical protein
MALQITCDMPSGTQPELAAAAAGGTPRSVSVWLLDKRALHDPTRPIDNRPMIALLEADCKQTTRLRHPGIVSAIETVEETRTHLVWVTEEVNGSLMSWMQGATKAVRTCSQSFSGLQYCTCNQLQGHAQADRTSSH